MNKNFVLILTTDSDFYQYIKQAIPAKRRAYRLRFHEGLRYTQETLALKRSRGKMPVVIVRRVSGSSISCNDGQEPIGKETSCKRPSYLKKTARADDLIQLIRRKVITGKNITI